VVTYIDWSICLRERVLDCKVTKFLWDFGYPRQR